MNKKQARDAYKKIQKISQQLVEDDNYPEESMTGNDPDYKRYMKDKISNAASEFTRQLWMDMGMERKMDTYLLPSMEVNDAVIDAVTPIVQKWIEDGRRKFNIGTAFESLRGENQMHDEENQMFDEENEL